MAHFDSNLANQNSWIHELARTEIYPDAEKLLNFGSSFDPQQLVEESTINFLNELRERFSEYSHVFNSYSEAGHRFQEVKVYSLAQAAADFMIFRNQVKLMFSNTAHGIIQISFAHHLRGNVAVDGHIQDGGSKEPHLGQVQELLAQLGPFRNVYWTFQGEKVSPSQVAKFYFTEFTRMTRDTSESRNSNQILLEQIKTLLNEKGLDL